MQWFGKMLGAALGYAVAGPLGSLFGVLVGHQFDQARGGHYAGFGRPSQQTQKVFFEVCFEVMGHLAKADGRVSEEEIRVARRIMHGMRLTPEQVQAAIARFTAGKAARYPLAERLDELNRHIGRRRDLARAFVEIQLQAAIGGGEIANSKRQRLWQVAQAIGVGRVELAQIEALIRAHLGRTAPAAGDGMALSGAYRVLGVEADASDNEVKTAYRRLMNQHHPDKLVSKGLPESMVALAEEKTREIRAAYERVKAERDFK